jgi:hypothetical protein
MAFTKRQQITYRTLVQRAYEVTAEREGIVAQLASLPAKVRNSAKDKWYRGVLHEALGVWTTKAVSPRRFAAACAAFEDIIGEADYWHKKAGEEALHNARFDLNKLMLEHEVEESYAKGIALQMKFPPLGLCDADQLRAVMIALIKKVRKEE